jgi:hypothetical protein
MSNMTNTLETAVSNAVLRGGTYTGGRLWMALFTAAPSETGGGTEATYTGYARVSFRSGAQVDSDQFTVPDGAGTASNSNDLVYAANSGSAQTVTHFGIMDASSGGNMLFWGALAASKTIDPTDIPSFPAGTVKITWN